MNRNITPEPGIYYNISAETYFSWNCFSKSMIRETMRSAKHLKEYLNTNFKTSAMTLGSLIDAMLLEPDELHKFPVLPDFGYDAKGNQKPWSLQMKSCKEIYNEHVNNGLNPIESCEYEEALCIVNNIKNNNHAVGLLGGKKQIAIVWTDQSTGVLCKSRIDVLNDNSIVDLKTTHNASKKEFERTSINLGYHVQAGMYQEGFKILSEKELSYMLVVAETKSPYDNLVCEFTEDALDWGRKEFHEAVRVYKHYLDTDPLFENGYSDDIRMIDAPPWVINRLEEIEDRLLAETEK